MSISYPDGDIFVDSWTVEQQWNTEQGKERWYVHIELFSVK